MQVVVAGAGVAGLCCALELAERGASVQVLERGATLGAQSCSWYAGGMLAPWCELETAEPLVARLGQESLRWWSARIASVARHGTLVVAHGRDEPELARFARRTGQAAPGRYAWLDAEGIAALEPDLAGRFRKALLFNDEGHLEPRAALHSLADRLHQAGVPIRFGVTADSQDTADADHVVDCTGLAARAALADLRGVKGEMLVLRSRDIAFRRPIRVLHPRWPLYLVPRGEDRIMVGATTIESDDVRVTARSVLELLGAAHAVHPALGEADIVEIGAQARPAFPDNLPRLRLRGRTLYVNGLYRHGFLLAPALARMTAQVLLEGKRFAEVMDENSREWRLA
ncbi:MAG: glycine oxidase ThiO [Proteobacteria bacterium]|nr:MAG: glycine oxidase ThiO [Pseudomonadota bacterium]